VQAVVYGVAAAALAVWVALHLAEARVSPAAGLAVATLAFLLVCGLAWRLLGAAEAKLVWDGRQWLVGGEPRQVGLMLQTGSCLLLRLQAAPFKTSWLAVERAEAGPAWHGLLVALHASPTAEAQFSEGQGG
jgi:hypothetical protein